MTDREKLIELIRCADYHPCKGAVKTIGSMFATEFIEDIASNLIANGVTVQKWIPVTERLPESYVSVLVLRQRFDDGGRLQKIEHIIPVYGGEFAWFMDMASWKSKVTHWMPLPKWPEEQRKENEE